MRELALMVLPYPYPLYISNYSNIVHGRNTMIVIFAARHALTGRLQLTLD